MRTVDDRKRTQKKTIILDAAKRLLQDKDYASVHVLDIAKEAGISKSNVFYYFDSKEKIFLELLIREYDLRFNAFIDYFSKCEKHSYEVFRDQILGELTALVRSDRSVFVELVVLKNVLLSERVDDDYIDQTLRDCFRLLTGLAKVLEDYIGHVEWEDLFSMFLAEEALIIGFRTVYNENLTRIVEHRPLLGGLNDRVTLIQNTVSQYMDGKFKRDKNQ